MGYSPTLRAAFVVLRINSMTELEHVDTHTVFARRDESSSLRKRALISNELFS